MGMTLKHERNEQDAMIRDFWDALVSVTLATERWSGRKASSLDRIALHYVEVAAEGRIRALAEAVGRGEVDLERLRQAPELDEGEAHELLSKAPKRLEVRSIADAVLAVDVALLRDPAFARRRVELDQRDEAAE